MEILQGGTRVGVWLSRVVTLVSIFVFFSWHLLSGGLEWGVWSGVGRWAFVVTFAIPRISLTYLGHWVDLCDDSGFRSDSVLALALCLTLDWLADPLSLDE